MHCYPFFHQIKKSLGDKKSGHLLRWTGGCLIRLYRNWFGLTQHRSSYRGDRLSRFDCILYKDTDQWSWFDLQRTFIFKKVTINPQKFVLKIFQYSYQTQTSWSHELVYIWNSFLIKMWFSHTTEKLSGFGILNYFCINKQILLDPQRH